MNSLILAIFTGLHFFVTLAEQDSSSEDKVDKKSKDDKALDSIECGDDIICVECLNQKEEKKAGCPCDCDDKSKKPNPAYNGNVPCECLDCNGNVKEDVNITQTKQPLANTK